MDADLEGLLSILHNGDAIASQIEALSIQLAYAKQDNLDLMEENRQLTIALEKLANSTSPPLAPDKSPLSTFPAKTPPQKRISWVEKAVLAKKDAEARSEALVVVEEKVRTASSKSSKLLSSATAVHVRL